MSGAKDLPNGAQLSTWKAQQAAAANARHVITSANRIRRIATWYRWVVGWTRKTASFQSTHTTHRDRAALCVANAVRNTGRQWRLLRKRLAGNQASARGAS